MTSTPYYVRTKLFCSPIVDILQYTDLYLTTSDAVLVHLSDSTSLIKLAPLSNNLDSKFSFTIFLQKISPSNKSVQNKYIDLTKIHLC